MEKRMTTPQHQRSRPTWTLLMLLAALGSSVALAANKGGALDAKARYQRESAACAAIRSVDDRANCLGEARARFASAQPALADEHPDVLKRNALKRCEPLPEPERKDCVARMQGEGTRSGSVTGGGIYRELVTREVGVPGAVKAEPATPPETVR
jgi:hypothetical protein